MSPNLHPLYFLLLFLPSILPSKPHKLTHFQLTPSTHYLVLFTQNNDHILKLNFKLNFDQTSIFITKQLEGSKLYLDRYLKKQINRKIKVFGENGRREIDGGLRDGKRQAIHGVIGMKSNSEFFYAVKDAIDGEMFKLWFKIDQNRVEILQDKCNIMANFPLQIKIESSYYSQLIEMRHLSLDFMPKSHKLLNVIGKKENPFSITSAQLSGKLNLHFINRLESISLNQIFDSNCYMISGSDSYQCDIYKNNNGNTQDNFGILLFKFNPIICPTHSGIEVAVGEREINSESYYWIHVLLILINIAIVGLFKYRFMAMKKTVGILGFRKHSRSH